MHRAQLDDQAYNELLNLLNNQHLTEKPGEERDMHFLSDDWWLRDTSVIEHIVPREGMWEIQLVFAHYLQPLKLIKRAIKRCTSIRRAEISAWYMRRLAAKDQRGTLTIDVKAFKLCTN